MFAHDFHDLVHRHDSAVQVGDDKGAGRRTNGFFQQPGIEVPVICRHVDKHRQSADRMNIQKVAGIVICRQQYFVAWAYLHCS